MLNVGWQPPPSDWLKINVDDLNGARNSHSGLAACGGIIREASGTFVKGFVCNKGNYSALKAELLALLHEIKVVRNLSIRKAIFKTDSIAIINYVIGGLPIQNQFKSLLQEIIFLLRKNDWQASLKHTFRESNKCTDFLARSGFEAALQVQLVESVNPLLAVFVNNDCSGGFTPHFVA